MLTLLGAVTSGAASNALFNFLIIVGGGALAVVAIIGAIIKKLEKK